MNLNRKKHLTAYILLFLTFTGTNSLLRHLTDNPDWQDLNMLVNAVEGLIFIAICFIIEISARLIYRKLRN